MANPDMQHFGAGIDDAASGKAEEADGKVACPL